MLLISLQLNLRNFPLNNHPIRPPNGASGDLGNWKWNRILVAVATSLFLHFSFCFILIIPRLAELRPFKCQCRTVSLWRWLWPAISKNVIHWDRLLVCIALIERQLQNLHLLRRHCPCNFLQEPTSPKHEYRGKLWGHPVTSSMTSSPWKKKTFWPFWARDKLFYRKLYRKLNIPER